MDSPTYSETNYPDKQTIKRQFSRIGFAMLSFIIVGQFLGVLLLTFLATQVTSIISLGDFVKSLPLQFVITYTSLYGIALPITIFLLRNIPKSIVTHTTTYTPVQVLKFCAVSYAIVYITANITQMVQQAIPFLADSYQETTNGLLTGSMCFSFFLVVVVAPIMEEILFRHILLSRLRGYGDKFAIVVCGLFFGLFHLNITQFFFAFASGCVLSYATLRTGNIKLAVLLHIFVNFMGSVVPMAAMHWGAEVPVGLFILSIVLIGVILLALERKNLIFHANEVALTKREVYKLFFGSSGVISFIVVSVLIIGLTLI